MLSNLQAIF